MNLQALAFHKSKGDCSTAICLLWYEISILYVPNPWSFIQCHYLNQVVNNGGSTWTHRSYWKLATKRLLVTKCTKSFDFWRYDFLVCFSSNFRAHPFFLLLVGCLRVKHLLPLVKGDRVPVVSPVRLEVAVQYRY